MPPPPKTSDGDSYQRPTYDVQPSLPFFTYGGDDQPTTDGGSYSDSGSGDCGSSGDSSGGGCD